MRNDRIRLTRELLVIRVILRIWELLGELRVVREWAPETSAWNPVPEGLPSRRTRSDGGASKISVVVEVRI